MLFHPFVLVWTTILHEVGIKVYLESFHFKRRWFTRLPAGHLFITTGYKKVDWLQKRDIESLQTITTVNHA